MSEYGVYMKGDISLLKDLWNNLPLNYKKFIVILLIVLAFSSFFVVYYFSDGLEELINMSRKVSPVEK